MASPIPEPFRPAPDVASEAHGFAPRFSIGVDPVWLRRTGDVGTTWSDAGALGGFGEDCAAMYRASWYQNPMERLEFGFLGSFHWSRNTDHAGPASALLASSPTEPNWIAGFQGSQRHAQTSRAQLRAYECNKRWITDDLSNYFIGAHLIDYRENYSLTSTDSDGDSRMGLGGSNLLAGMQGGLELWRPISQRFALGGQGLAGLYGNFAEGSWQIDSQNQGGFESRDSRFQVAASFGLEAKLRYQFTSRCQAFGGYRWWYLAGLATVDDQTVGPLASVTPFALSTDAGFLLQGATCGIEWVF